MKFRLSIMLACFALVLCTPFVQAQSAPVDIELWITPAVTEAGSPPDDWVGYKIIRDKLNINLKAVMLPSTFTDQDTKINTAAAANKLPDIVHVNRDTWYKLTKAGLFAPVDSLLAKMPNRTATHYDDPLRNKMAMYKGKLYGLPDPGKLPKTDGWVIRKDWLDKLGLPIPKTIDDFYNVAKAFTEKDPDGNGKNDTYGFGAFVETSDITNWGLGVRFDPIFSAFGVTGVWNVDSQKTFGLNVRTPEFYQALEFVKKLVDAKVIDPDWATLKKDEFRARWKQGRFGIMRENFAALSTKANYADFDKNFPTGEWIAIPPPVGPKGKSAEGMNYIDMRIHAVSQRAIAAGKADAIARLLEWMASDEGYYLLGFGVKGVNYNLDDNGNITEKGIDPAVLYSSKAAQPLTQLRNLVFVNNELELLPRYVPYKTSNGRAMEPLKFWKYFSSQKWYEATAAQLINPPSNAADFSRFYSENIVKFALGLQPLNATTWKDFLAGLDKLGAPALEAAAKTQLIDAELLD